MLVVLPPVVERTHAQHLPESIDHLPAERFLRPPHCPLTHMPPDELQRPASACASPSR
jgi:hypothetical protein